MVIRPLSIQQVAWSCLLFVTAFHSISCFLNDLLVIGLVYLIAGAFVARVLLRSRINESKSYQGGTYFQSETQEDEASQINSLKAPLGQSAFLLFWLVFIISSGSSEWREHSNSVYWLYPVLLCSQILLIEFSPAKVFCFLCITGSSTIYLSSSMQFDIEAYLSMLLFLLFSWVISRYIGKIKDDLRQANTKDRLTGCINLQEFSTELYKAAELQKRYGTPVSSIVITVDAGVYKNRSLNKCLQEVAQIFQSRLRQTDILCRIDNKRFLVLLPSTHVKNAEKLNTDLITASSAFEFSYVANNKNQQGPQFSSQIFTYTAEYPADQWLYELIS